MSKPQWTPLPIVEIVQRINLLSLRLARLKLAEQAARDVALVKALTSEQPE